VSEVSQKTLALNLLRLVNLAEIVQCFKRKDVSKSAHAEVA